MFKKSFFFKISFFFLFYNQQIILRNHLQNDVIGDIFFVVKSPNLVNDRNGFDGNIFDKSGEMLLSNVFPKPKNKEFDDIIGLFDRFKFIDRYIVQI